MSELTDHLVDLINGLDAVATQIPELVEKLDELFKAEKLKAVTVLLVNPEQITAGLERELHAYRDWVMGVPGSGGYGRT